MDEDAGLIYYTARSGDNPLGELPLAPLAAPAAAGVLDRARDRGELRIPPAPDFETEMSGEIWYSVARNDIFPEEFETFLLTDPKTRECFRYFHADLLEPEWWTTFDPVRTPSVEIRGSAAARRAASAIASSQSLAS